MNMPPIVSPQEWKSAREELLVKEKELTRAQDALAAERRRMPRMAVENGYAFDGPDGPASLLDLFEGRRQLIVYRFFFEPGVAGWPESGCRGCSFMADQVAHLAHLNARETTFVNVSRAPQADIERWKTRMGWEIPWYTITDDFDADFGVDEWHGTNVFLREGDQIFRTYFVDKRGDEALGRLEVPRHHRAGSPGGLGGLARGLPADPALRLVEPPRRVRRGDRLRARPVGRDRLAARRSAPPSGRTGALEMTGNETVRLERTFHAPAEAVFEAWTSEEVMRRWWEAEHHWETSEAEVDLRVGGAVRVVMHDPDKDADYGGGNYTEIDPPTRLAFTWIWDGDTRRTLIELDFEETDGLQRELEAQRPEE